MKKFYGEDIDKIETQYLLNATPYKREARINFSKRLTPDIFFDEQGLYMGDDKDADYGSQQENCRFQNEIREKLNCLDNKFAKVDLLHIAGYAGCGKTTFVRHLLWELQKDSNYDYDVIDFEGSDKLAIPLQRRIAHRASNDFIEKRDYLNKLIEGNIFYIENFYKIIDYLKDFIIKLEKINVDKAEKCIFEMLSSQQLKCNSYEKYCYWLIVLEFLLNLYDCVRSQDSKPVILFFDNIDSIDMLEEEYVFLSTIKEFINDCNFFFGLNINNENKYLNHTISEYIDKTKFVFFINTRIVTIKKYLELTPDLEEIYGWYSINMPENYYNHKQIIDKRVNYYVSLEQGKESETIRRLKNINDFAEIVYKTNVYKKTFNGNIRFCIDTLCKIDRMEQNEQLIEQSIKLSKLKNIISESAEGSNGIVISILVNYFKDSGMYRQKLHLSECQCDHKVSLSRLILTIIREKGGNCSLLDIFILLSPFFELDHICEVVWDLSETGRDCWRRLINFNCKFPKTPADINKQADLFKNKDFNFNDYSEINLCTAGNAYLDYIIPHFEFMHSRHKYEVENLRKEKYQPLFCESSEKVLKNANDEQKYFFEKKIDWVYKDVADCCENSVFFAKKIMEEFGLTREEYLENSYYNYHIINKDKTCGIRQSYESRLIFSHIGYIERYRRYLLNKRKMHVVHELIDINKRLVNRIKRYLDLYFDSEKCFQTMPQNEAAKALYNQISIIEERKFSDFKTKIEVVKEGY